MENNKKQSLDTSQLTDEQKEAFKEVYEANLNIEVAAHQNGVGQVFNRAERRKKLKFLHKQLEIHNRKKPNIAHDPSVEVPKEILEKNISKMRAWATRYGILIRKINELENWERR